MYFELKTCKLTIGERWLDSFLVKFPVSIRYNGGTIIDGEWFDGYKVAPPTVPEGFKLVGIGVGHCLNSRPPQATRFLKPLDGRRVKKAELKAILG